MEVHVVTVLLMLALIQVAQSSLEEFHLTTCSQTRMPCTCIRKDTTEVPNFEKTNITVEMQIVLPFPDLTELWHNDTKICIVGSSGTAINFGKELKHNQHKQRYKLNFYFTRLDTDWGELYVELQVTNLKFIDTNPLRLELRLEDINYITNGTDWMPVKEKNITSADPGVPVTQRPNTSSESAQRPNTSSESAQRPNTSSESAQRPNTSSESAQRPNTSSELAQRPNTSSELAQKPNTSSESGQEHDNMTKPMDINETLSSCHKGNGWRTVALIFIVLFCILLAVVLSFKLYGMYKGKQQEYLCNNATEVLEPPWTIKKSDLLKSETEKYEGN